MSLEHQSPAGLEGDAVVVEVIDLVAVIDPQRAAVLDNDPARAVVSQVVVHPQRGALADLDGSAEVVVVVRAGAGVREGDGRPVGNRAVLLEVHTLVVVVIQVRVEVDLDPERTGALERVLPRPHRAADDVDLGVSAGGIEVRVSVTDLPVLQDVDVGCPSAGQRSVVLAAVGEERTDVRALECRIAKALDRLAGRHAVSGILQRDEHLGRPAHFSQRRLGEHSGGRIDQGVILEGDHARTRRVRVRQVGKVAFQKTERLYKHLGRLVDGRVEVDAPAFCDREGRFAGSAVAQTVAGIEGQSTVDQHGGVKRTAGVDVHRTVKLHPVGGQNTAAVDVHRGAGSDGGRLPHRTHPPQARLVRSRRLDHLLAEHRGRDKELGVRPAAVFALGERHQVITGGQADGLGAAVVPGELLAAVRSKPGWGGLEYAVLVEVEPDTAAVVLGASPERVITCGGDVQVTNEQVHVIVALVYRAAVDEVGVTVEVQSAPVRPVSQEDRGVRSGGHQTAVVVEVHQGLRLDVITAVLHCVGRDDDIPGADGCRCHRGVYVDRAGIKDVQRFGRRDRGIYVQRTALDSGPTGVCVGEPGADSGVPVARDGAGGPVGVGHCKADRTALENVCVGLQEVVCGQCRRSAVLPVGSDRQGATYTAEVERAAVIYEVPNRHIAADRQRAAVEGEVAVYRHAVGYGGRPARDPDGQRVEDRAGVKIGRPVQGYDLGVDLAGNVHRSASHVQ